MGREEHLLLCEEIKDEEVFKWYEDLEEKRG